MSTTKDKSQGPYTVEPIGGYGACTVNGPSIVSGIFQDEPHAQEEANKLNAAYQAGQADRDELVKALLQAKYRIERCTEKLEKIQRETGIPSEISMLANDAVVEHITDLLTRITNP